MSSMRPATSEASASASCTACWPAACAVSSLQPRVATFFFKRLSFARLSRFSHLLRVAALLFASTRQTEGPSVPVSTISRVSPWQPQWRKGRRRRSELTQQRLRPIIPESGWSEPRRKRTACEGGGSDSTHHIGAEAGFRCRTGCRWHRWGWTLQTSHSTAETPPSCLWVFGGLCPCLCPYLRPHLCPALFVWERKLYSRRSQ